MSIHATTLGAHGAIDTSSRPATKGLWHRVLDKLVAARQEQARRQIEAYINGLSEQQRKDLGFPTAADRR